jgi:SAM-dependent methyltransferase
VTGNQDQIDYWNGPTGEKWARHQEDMDRNLAGPLAGLLKLAAPQAGERVLDVGCGAGVSSRAAAALVGPKGFVLGMDISSPLLGRARAHGGGVTYVEADAAHYPFKPEFDLILSRFGVMFFDAPVPAFANLRKAIVKGGRLAFVCWRPLAENEWAAMATAIVGPIAPPQPPPEPDAPGPFVFADPSRVRAILEGAGFGDIRTQKLDGVMELGTSAEHAGFQMTELGPATRLLKGADDATRARAQEAVTAAYAAKWKKGQQIAPGIACWLVSAKA